ncbi:unnamed protein product [Polarella glacialis]|uniref:protein-tyrosine-phosphatase n=1 Tax=Polarella glacialis TaxID=89957 RepID=A0A813ELX2_POLGL|nr:unnamed protein product [Polarella glacialis]
MPAPCLLCGADSLLALAQGELRCCSACEPRARALPAEAVGALVELDSIKPAFSIWGRGRREDSGEAARKAVCVPQQPAEIAPCAAPGLFVGDLDDVQNVARLRELNIGFVLNLCPDNLTGHYADLPSRLAKEGIKQLTWPAQDYWNFDIITEVVEKGACDFIEFGLRSAGVLVNCWGGVNRSAAVAVAFLVLRRSVPLVDAVRKTMSRRGTVLTKQSFRFLLVKAAMAAGQPLLGSAEQEATELAAGSGMSGLVASNLTTTIVKKLHNNSSSNTNNYHNNSNLSATSDRGSGTGFAAAGELPLLEWECKDPVKRHQGKGARDNAKYGYLYAATWLCVGLLFYLVLFVSNCEARAPCIQCVKYYIDQEQVDPKSISDSNSYSAIDFAEWELSRCNAQDACRYQAVLTYLRPLVGN